MIFCLHVVTFGERETEYLRRMNNEGSLGIHEYCRVPECLVVQLPFSGALDACKQRGADQVGARVEYRRLLSLLCVIPVVSGFRLLKWLMIKHYK